jgi:hypothetical protein
MVGVWVGMVFVIMFMVMPVSVLVVIIMFVRMFVCMCFAGHTGTPCCIVLPGSSGASCTNTFNVVVVTFLT